MDNQHTQNASVEEIRVWLVQQISETLDVEPAEIDIDQPFEHFGLSSRESVTLSGDLEEWLQIRLPATLVWQYPTIRSLASHLASVMIGLNQDLVQKADPIAGDERVEPKSNQGDKPGIAPSYSASQCVSDQPENINPERKLTQREPIAIIGIGCRFPGANTPEKFWNLLCEGVDAIQEVPPERWNIDAIYDPDSSVPGKINTRWGGFIDDVDKFDAGYFGISPREAERMDPQQRILLEVAVEALEDAGLVVERLSGTSTGVYIGIMGNEYNQFQFSDLELIDAYAGTGNALSIAANRISYFLNLKGPSIAIDTACSSSLVAVHLACCSLWQGEACLALAGGVNLILTPSVTINFTKAGAMAPDGRCKSFDARADGYVRSEGAGIVVLKPLSQAIADGDSIYATILGSAINHDGRSNGLMAPNPQAQAQVLSEAYRRAGVRPGDVQYVETHGTGTLLGDPIEAQALAEVLSDGRRPGDRCRIGAVKTNIGHLESAAGIAGLVKAALALWHAKIPANLHFEQPNPHIPFDKFPLQVQNRLTPWPPHEGRTLAGVSSFGFGGTNAHVVLEAFPREPNTPLESEKQTGHYLLPLSARSLPALKQLASSYCELLQNLCGDTGNLLDICATASLRRTHHEYRLAVTGEDVQDLLLGLQSYQMDEHLPSVTSNRISGEKYKIVFVYPGQGSQWAGMGSQLIEREPVFRNALLACDRAIKPYTGWSIIEVLSRPKDETWLEDISIIQPVLFAMEVGLSELWRSWGIKPQAVIGHSMGEVAAAYMAGALSLEDSARVICVRSSLLKKISGMGGMLAVGLSFDKAKEFLGDYSNQVCVAVTNSPGTCVLSGDSAALEVLVGKFSDQGVFCKYVKADVAAHSPQVESLRLELEKSISDLESAKEYTAIYSTVTCLPVRGEDMRAEYWGRNLREPVRFGSTIGQLLMDGYNLFVEISPHPILTTSIRQVIQSVNKEAVTLDSLERQQDETLALLNTLGVLHTLDTPVLWEALYQSGYECAHLPTYPWQQRRFWLGSSDIPGKRARTTPLIEKAPRVSVSAGLAAGLDDWLYSLAWERQDRMPAPQLTEANSYTWMVFSDRQGVSEEVLANLELSHQRCISIRAGSAFSQHSDFEYSVRRNNKDDLRTIFDIFLRTDAHSCRGILYLWGLENPHPDQAPGFPGAAAALDCADVTHLVQLIEEFKLRRPPRLWLVTRGAQFVIPRDRLSPAQAPLWGLGRTIAQEAPALWGGLIDLDPEGKPEQDGFSIWGEVWLPEDQLQIAYRGNQRYSARLERVSIGRQEQKNLALRPDASYLITGGLGDLGLAVACWLAEQGARQLILVSRSGLPSSQSWNTDLNQVQDSKISRTFAAVRELKAKGVQLELAHFDVADRQAFVEYLQERSRRDDPPIRGVIHAAGILQDSMLGSLDLDAFQSVMRAKVDGGWLLHQLFSTPDHPPLDFFVLFSSAAAILGSAGQGNYSAANAFLDALAYYRSEQRLPALSINWGPWEGIGLAAHQERGGRLKQFSIDSIPPETGLAILGQLLGQEIPQALVISVDWERFSRFLPGGGDLLSKLVCESRETGKESHEAGEKPVHVSRESRPPGEVLPNQMQRYLRQQIGNVLFMSPEDVPTDRHFLELGLDSLMAMEMLYNVEKDFKIKLYPREVFEQATIQKLAVYLAGELKRQNGHDVTEDGSLKSSESVSSTIDGLLTGLRSPLKQSLRRERILQKNPPMVFLLSTPRAGSTLLRVMLAGSPHLFCPPELHLLQFDSMDLRRRGLGATYLNEGLQRALMELQGLDGEQSHSMLEELVSGDASTISVYEQLQKMAGERLLMDKSPSYGANMETLERAEDWFVEPKYIFLYRHPYAVIDSFVRNRFDRLLGAGNTDPYVLAEQVWSNINANILDFLLQVPKNRYHPVKYEELVLEPEIVARRLADFLGIPFDPAMLKPYDGNRMTDGVHGTSMGINDPNFLQHDRIETGFGEVWKSVQLPRRLGGYARRVAVELGYELPNETPAKRGRIETAGARDDRQELTYQLAGEIAGDQALELEESSPLVPIQPNGDKRAIFFIHPGGGVVYPYYELARAIGKKRPFFAIQDLSLEGGREPYQDIEQYAQEYLQVVRQVQPQGPYYLGGWSFGGHVAIEMARRLIESGQPVGLLFILDTEAPVAGRKLTLYQRLRYLKNRLLEYTTGLPDLIPYVRDAIYLLTAKKEELQGTQVEKLTLTEYLQWGWMDSFRKRLTEKAGIVQVLERDQELRRVRLPRSNVRRGLYILRRHIAIVNSFEPELYPGKLTFLKAEDQIVRKYYTDETLGWGELAADVEVYIVPGNHMTMFREPHVHSLSKILKESIAKFEAGGV